MEQAGGRLHRSAPGCAGRSIGWGFKPAKGGAGEGLARDELKQLPKKRRKSITEQQKVRNCLKDWKTREEPGIKGSRAGLVRTGEEGDLGRQ